MTFAHATKTGKAQIARCELALTETRGRLTLRILTLMKNALEQVSATGRLASASASLVFLAMHANAALAPTTAMATALAVYFQSSRRLSLTTRGTLSKSKPAFATLAFSTLIARSDDALPVMTR